MAQKPNIILIVADDLGVECLQSYGGESYETPNLNKLAESGVQFSHCFSQPYSTSSRLKLMTGRYNFRNYKDYRVLPKNEIHFGHLAKKAGYKTGIFGKWHLGGNKSTFNKTNGFDESILWNINSSGSRYRSPLFFKNGEKLKDSIDKYGPDVLSRQVQGFIRKNKNESFFVYYPMVLPHLPYQITPTNPNWGKKGFENIKNFKEMVEYMDKMIGRIVITLKKMKVYDNTVIIFTADSGSHVGIVSKQNGKLVYGADGHMTNAGTNVPLIICWGDELEKGAKSDALIDFSDFLPSLAEIMEIDLPTDRKIDGVSFTRLLTNPNYSERTYTFCHFNPGKTVDTPSKRLDTGNFVRDKKYKLYGNGELFNLESDPLELSPLTSDKVPSDVYNFLMKTMKEMKAEGSIVPVRRYKTGEITRSKEIISK